MASSGVVNSSCKNGLEFWRKTLNACRYAMGPRDHIPDLAFRLLCRHHGVQLCYTPMLDADEVANYSNNYDNQFTSRDCTSDRPLIAQFYLRDPDCLLQAAKRVAPYCDAIDINLNSESNGEDKTISRNGKGTDLNLLSKMMSLLRENLQMPVTCKIKITKNDDLLHLIDYAKQLEDAGCQLISVSCRHKEPQHQKRDWDVIKSIKKSVGIPIFAHADVANLTEADACIAYTGAEGVMGHVNLLHNPSLFTGSNPPVYAISKEFLDLCNEYPIAPKQIRIYLYSLWKNYLNYPGDASAISLKRQLHNAWTYDALREANSTLRENLISKGVTIEYEDCKSSNWLCQPESWNEHNLLLQEKDTTIRSIKLAKKRQVMQLRLHAKKQRKREERRLFTEQREPLLYEYGIYGRISKKERAALRKQKLSEALKNGQRIVVDMGLTKNMTAKEASRLCKQIGFLYGSNSCADKPWHIYFTRFAPENQVYQLCTKRHTGFENYKIDITSKSVIELFPSQDIVFLTPDSDRVLETIDSTKVYVLGGIVDESIRKHISLEYAKDCNVKTSRLPIPEHMSRAERGSFNQVLSINQVFDILLQFAKTGDWVEALSRGIPRRKGWIPNTYKVTANR